MTRLSADSIAMAFGLRRVLSGVFIEARAGDILGILGRNGSGKSTFYKCLLGLHRASTGSLRVDGRPVPKREALRFFAYLPQDSFLPLDARLAKSIDLVLGRKGNRSLFERDARAGSFLRARAMSLSVGEVRYVECLLALSLDRPIILLDEPFSQIEPIHCETLAERIREAATDRVIMISDHLYGNVQKVSTRMKVLNEGTLWDVDNDVESLTRYGYLG